jgi:hypothetical protein
MTTKIVNGNVIVMTDEEIAQSDIEYAALQEDNSDSEILNNRQNAYPPIEDYLDGIVKGDTAQVNKYIADCLAVKESYPKGS